MQPVKSIIWLDLTDKCKSKYKISVKTTSIQKSSLFFWSINPCNLTKDNCHFRETCSLHLQGQRIWYLLPSSAWLTLQPWRCTKYVSPYVRRLSTEYKVLQLTKKNTSHYCENLKSYTWIQFAEFVSHMIGLVWCEKTFRNITGDLGLAFWVSSYL
jgi:hypothetical protein